MKRVIAIIGSPRNGETLKAVRRFVEEMNKFEEIQVETVMLNKSGIKDCTGCHNCIMKGREFCHESIKIQEIQDKMMNSDGVILATPVYNQHITALMKKFMDYFTFLWHRPVMFGVKFFGISSGGGMFGPVFKYLKMNAENWGGIWAGSLGVPHYESLTEKYREKSDKDNHQKALDFLKAMEVKVLPKPTFGKLIWFNVWKMNAEAGKAELVKDYEHWTDTGWFNKNYYYDTKTGVLKNAAVKTVMMIMRSFMRKVYRGY